jgi:hypothetical protein
VAHVTLPSPDSARGSIAQKNRRVFPVPPLPLPEALDEFVP